MKISGIATTILMVVVVVVVVACRDQRSLLTEPMPVPQAGTTPAQTLAMVARWYPDAADHGTRDRAIWLVVDSTGTPQAWGRGAPASETATSNLVGVQFGRTGLRTAEPRQWPEDSRRSQSGLPEGKLLNPPLEWNGQRASVADSTLSGVRIIRAPSRRDPSQPVTVVVLH